MAYTPKKINDTTQIPEEITDFNSEEKRNIPQGVYIPQGDSSTATAPKDVCVVMFDPSLNAGAGGLAISPAGVTTFTVTII